MRLIAVTINGRTRFIYLASCADGMYRISMETITRIWGIKRGEGMRFN